MFEWSTINDFVASFAGFLSSLAIIVGAVYKWIWKPYAKKKEEREEERHQNMTRIANKIVGPVTERLEIIAEQTERHDEVDRNLEEIAEQNVAIIKEIREQFSEHNHHADNRDRAIAQNAEILKHHEEQFKQHDSRLDNHNDRLIVLETKNGISKVTYREGSENK